MSFHQKYYQLLLHGKFPMKEKKLLVVWPPDSRKTAWFASFQVILTNTDLLLRSPKVTVIICSRILFTKILYNTEASHFICIADQWSGFQILGDFTIFTYYSSLVTKSFTYNFNKNWNVLSSKFKWCGLFIWNRSYYKYFVKDESFRRLILWSLNSLSAEK